MTRNEQLQKKLTNVLSGHPWYGKPVYELLDTVGLEAAFEKSGSSPHSIANLLLHMFTWTEEVIDRLNEKPAGYPVSGNWPDPGQPDEEKWQRWKDDFKLVNVNLQKTIADFAPDKWDDNIINDELEDRVTYTELVEGLIEHHIYHVAQIVALNKTVTG